LANTAEASAERSREDERKQQRQSVPMSMTAQPTPLLGVLSTERRGVPEAVRRAQQALQASSAVPTAPAAVPNNMER
jgi:hypothetical protein